MNWNMGLNAWSLSLSGAAKELFFTGLGGALAALSTTSAAQVHIQGTLAGGTLGALTLVSAGLNGILWTPSQISGAFSFFLDSQLGVTQVAGAVSSWAQQFGTEAAAVQATAANKPTYSATSFPGNLPGITFDGVNDRLSIATFHELAAPYGVFAVVYNYAGSTGALIRDDATTAASLQRFNDTNLFLYYGSNYTLANTPSFDQSAFVVVGEVAANSLSHMDLNGTTNSSPAGSGTPLKLGGTTAATLSIGGTTADSNYAGVTVACVGALNRALSQAELDKFTGYLAWRWGITLDAAHPYALQRPHV